MQLQYELLELLGSWSGRQTSYSMIPFGLTKKHIITIIIWIGIVCSQIIIFVHC